MPSANEIKRKTANHSALVLDKTDFIYLAKLD